MLEKQLEYMYTPELNPFVPDEFDMADACPKELIVDEDHESDEDFDILLCNNSLFIGYLRV